MSMNQQAPTSPSAASGRPRPRSRGISFASNKSGTSEGSKKPVESPADKARRDSFWKGASKANPNAAVNEQQPAEANLREESTLANIREYRHKDSYGNAIADPDLSNPTRPRLERPLDTIRSFEKAIDDGYKRRSTYKPDSAEQYDQNNQYASRRSSYFGGEYQPQYPNDRAFANKRPSTGYESGPSPQRYAQQQGGYYGNQNGGQQRARYGNRMQSDPQFYNQSRPYPQHGYHQSHDTVNTGMTNGSDSTGPWGNSTDPSSENSSLDRVYAMNKPPPPPQHQQQPQQLNDGYGSYNQNGYNGPIMEEQGSGAYGDYPYQNGYGQQQNGYGQQQNGYGNPRANYPRHNTAPNDGPRRAPMGPPPPSKLPSNRAEPEKRKSWISRKFSRKDSN